MAQPNDTTTIKRFNLALTQQDIDVIEQLRTITGVRNRPDIVRMGLRALLRDHGSTAQTSRKPAGG